MVMKIEPIAAALAELRRPETRVIFLTPQGVPLRQPLVREYAKAEPLLVRALAQALSLKVGRIQFTPDLMPSDITGHAVLDPESRALRIVQGPVFTNLLLADEINRAPAKTQSALLEVMQEYQVTLEGQTLHRAAHHHRSERGRAAAQQRVARAHGSRRPRDATARLPPARGSRRDRLRGAHRARHARVAGPVDGQRFALLIGDLDRRALCFNWQFCGECCQQF